MNVRFFDKSNKVLSKILAHEVTRFLGVLEVT